MISLSGTISIAQEFKQLILCFLISIVSQLPSLGTAYKLIWSDATATLGFIYHTSEHVPPQNSTT